MSEVILEQEKTKTLTEIGFEKGYLQNREVFLLPMVGKRLTVITKEAESAHAFMYEGASVSFCLPQNERLDYFSPFESDAEQKFFEDITGIDLSYRNAKFNPKCFWHDANFQVSFTVSSEFKNMGYKLDLRSPMDVLRYKVLKLQYDICPSMEHAMDDKLRLPHWKWVLKSSEYKDTSKSKKADANMKAYKFFGAIEDHQNKMVDFINLFYANTKQAKEVADNTATTVLKATIEELIEKHVETVVQVIEDDQYDLKSLILKGAKVGALERHGINSYSFPGGHKYQFDEFVDFVQAAKDAQDEDYLKLLAKFQILDKKPKLK